jgi:hypothetical protein
VIFYYRSTDVMTFPPLVLQCTEESNWPESIYRHVNASSLHGGRSEKLILPPHLIVEE